MSTLALKPKRDQVEIDRLNDELDKAHEALMDVLSSPAFKMIPVASLTGYYLKNLIRINEPFEPEVFRNTKSARRDALHGMEALSQHAQALAQAMRLIMERAGESTTQEDHT
jgi:hypothetical protein